MEAHGVNDGDHVSTQQTNDGDQTKAVEEKEHSTLDVLDDPLYINKGPITRSKAKKMKEALYELIEEAKAKATIEVDVTKNESYNLVNLIQALNELN